MQKLIIGLIAVFSFSTAFTQQSEFEGRLVYRTEVKSRSATFSSALMQRLLFAGDKLTVYMKKGQYLRQTGVVDEYYVPKDEKVYIRFKGIDTLYYRDYADDTSTVLNMVKGTTAKKIAGYDCASLMLASHNDTSQLFYAPMLYENPVHHQKLRLNHMNVISEQTKSVWLEGESRTANYILRNSCLQVEPMTVDEALFVLPALPVAKLNNATLFTAPKYAGRSSWAVYLQQNMNLKLVANSIPLKKKEKVAEQAAKVSFVIAANGDVIDVYVLNMKDVHAALAEEAIRLVQKARWSPAVLLGEKIEFPLMQPIVFRVEAE